MSSTISREFERILQWGGSPTAQCSCGRTHFTLSGNFMEEGELDRLIANSKQDPNNFVGDTENDSVSITSVNGMTLVHGCPCRKLESLENVLWLNRDRFLQYYRERAARELKEAQSLAAALSDIPEKL